MGIQIPDSPDDLIRTWATVPTGKVSLLIPTDIYRRLLDTVERLPAERGERVSLPELVEEALLHYLDNELEWTV